MAQAVANPHHTELTALLAAARECQELNADLLATPARMMGRGDAWTGPSVATAFTADVQGRDTALQRHFEGLTASIAFHLASVPRTVASVG